MVEMASRIVRNDSSTCRVLQKFFGLMGCKMQETLDEAVEPGYSTARIRRPYVQIRSCPTLQLPGIDILHWY